MVVFWIWVLGGWWFLVWLGGGGGGGEGRGGGGGGGGGGGRNLLLQGKNLLRTEMLVAVYQTTRRHIPVHHTTDISHGCHNVNHKHLLYSGHIIFRRTPVWTSSWVWLPLLIIFTVFLIPPPANPYNYLECTGHTLSSKLHVLFLWCSNTLLSQSQTPNTGHDPPSWAHLEATA